MSKTGTEKIAAALVDVKGLESAVSPHCMRGPGGKTPPGAIGLS